MNNRITDKSGDVAEYFSTLSDLRRTLPGRRCYQSSSAYLTEDGSPDRRFNGFGDAAELRDLMDGGVKDISAVQGVAAFARKVKPTCAKTREKVTSATNGEFRMGRFLAGKQDCFVKKKRISHPTPKVVKIVVNMSVHCGIEPKQIDNACKVISRNIVALEKSGVRVRLVTCCTGEWPSRGRTKLSVCAVTLKEPEQPLNFRKLLFGLSTTMFRGPLFHWLACEEDVPYTLGHPVQSKSRVLPLLQQVMNADDVYYFTVKDLIDHNERNRNDLEESSRWLADQIKV